MGGVPCIRHLRIPVATVVDMVADGMPTAEILDAYPDLEAEDIGEALRYAAERESRYLLSSETMKKRLLEARERREGISFEAAREELGI